MKNRIIRIFTYVLLTMLFISPINVLATNKYNSNQWKKRYEKFINGNKSFKLDNSLYYLPVYIDNNDTPELLYYDYENLGILNYSNGKIYDTGFSDRKLFSYIPKKNKFRYAYYDNSQLKKNNYIIVYDAINSLKNGKIKTLYSGKYHIYKDGKMVFYSSGNKKISKKEYFKNIDKYYNFKKALTFDGFKGSSMNQKELFNYLK